MIPWRRHSRNFRGAKPLAKGAVALARQPSYLYAGGLITGFIGGAGLLCSLAYVVQTGAMPTTLTVASAIVLTIGGFSILTGIAWNGHKLTKSCSRLIADLGDLQDRLNSFLEGSRRVGSGAQGGDSATFALRAEFAEQMAQLFTSVERLDSRLEQCAKELEKHNDSEATEGKRASASGNPDKEPVSNGRDQSSTDDDAKVTSRNLPGTGASSSHEEREKAEQGDATEGNVDGERNIEDIGTGFIRSALKTETNRLRTSMRYERRQLEAWQALHSYIQPPSLLPSPGGFAIEPDVAAYLVRLVMEQRPNIVLELGSGLSTLVLGLAVRRQGSGTVISFEDDARFLERTQRLVAEFGLSECTRVNLSKLKEVTIEDAAYRWYETTQLQGVGPIDLLFIDGPFASGGVMVRYPAVPMLLEHMRPGSLIILDDYLRNDERRAVEYWVREYPVEFIEAPKHLHGTAVLRITETPA